MRLNQQEFERAFRKSGPTLHYLFPLDERAGEQAQKGEAANFNDGVWMIVVPDQPYAVGLRRAGEDTIVARCRTWFMVGTMMAQAARTNDFQDPAKSTEWVASVIARGDV